MADHSGRGSDFGATLKKARESKGISLSEIAESTKISTGVLSSLEQNDIRSLPGGIFTRSFVRSYAGAVGLDPEETVHAFLEAFPATDANVGEAYSQPRAQEEFDVYANQRAIRQTTIGLLCVSIPVAALLVVLGLGEGSDTVSPEVPEAVIELGSPQAAETSRTSSASDVAEGSLAAQTRPLVIDIHPREACWVSLTLDGSRAFSRVMQPGEREVHEASHEIVLNVGNAGVFDFAINQQPGQALGTSGEAVTARIDRHNFHEYLVHQAGGLRDAASH